jgi:hypothetical protein
LASLERISFAFEGSQLFLLVPYTQELTSPKPISFPHPIAKTSDLSSSPNTSPNVQQNAPSLLAEKAPFAQHSPEYLVPRLIRLFHPPHIILELIHRIL